MQALLCSRRIPGPTSFWEVVVIAPEGLCFRKVFRVCPGVSLHPDNTRKRLSGRRATALFSCFGSRKSDGRSPATKLGPNGPARSPVRRRRQRLEDLVRQAAGGAFVPSGRL